MVTVFIFITSASAIIGGLSNLLNENMLSFDGAVLLQTNLAVELKGKQREECARSAKCSWWEDVGLQLQATSSKMQGLQNISVITSVVSFIIMGH
jgi:hypothetical protein